MKSAAVLVAFALGLAGAHASGGGEEGVFEVESTNDGVDGCGNSLVAGDLGTKCAPTKSGGDCLGDDDWGKWTRGSEPSGFDAYPIDMQACGSECSTQLISSSGCGGLFASETCPPEGTYALCVSLCMQGAPEAPTEQDIATYTDLITSPLVGPNYTQPCAYCMGVAAQCTADNCKSECAGSGAKISNCQECNTKFCNEAFTVCAGIDPTIVHDEGPNVVLISAVSGGVFVVLLLASLIVCRSRRLRVKQEQTMGLHELNAMAQKQANPDGEDNMADLDDFDELNGPGAQQADPFAAGMYQPAPVMNFQQQAAPVGAPPGQMSDYEKAYHAQQQAMAQGQAPPAFSAPSERVRTMALNAPPAGVFSTQATPLQVIYPFQGSSQDELTVAQGEQIQGIEESDNWWLARTNAGQVGLVPSNYVQITNVVVGDPNVEF